LSYVLHAKGQGGSEAEGVGARAVDVQASSLEPSLHAVDVLAVKSEVSSVASHVRNESGFAAHSRQLNFEEGTGVFLQMEQVLVLNYSPYLPVVEDFHQVDLLRVRNGLFV